MKAQKSQPNKSSKRPKQFALIKSESSAYGGDLLTKRKARSRPRPISTRETMHLVLRSTKATGAMSFLREKNKNHVQRILAKFSAKYGVRVLATGNAGNHLHLHLKLSSRQTYKAFIRAITGSIAMAITGKTRWTPQRKQQDSAFFDRRPFTRIVQSLKAFLNLKNYVRVNQLEGYGFTRPEAREMIRTEITRIATRPRP